MIVCRCAILRDGLKRSWFILDGASHTGLAIFDDRTLRGAFVKQFFECLCCAGPLLVEIIIEPTTTLLHALLSTNSIVTDECGQLTHRHRTRAFPPASGGSEQPHVLRDPTVCLMNVCMRLVTGECTVDDGGICSHLPSTTWFTNDFEQVKLDFSSCITEFPGPYSCRTFLCRQRSLSSRLRWFPAKALLPKVKCQ